MLVRRKPPKLGIRENARHFPGHLAFVRGFVCSIFDKHQCEGRIEAAHVRSGTGGGTGIKPGDQWAIPLCGAAHKEQHQIGEAAFSMKDGIDMKALAERWARISPHRHRWSNDG